MQRLLVLCLYTVPALLACEQQDPPPHFIDVAYQVRCIDCMPLTTDDPTRDVLAIDAEDGYEVACSASGSKPLVTFSVKHPDAKKGSDNFELRVIQASLASKDPGSSCVVRVTEGDNTYEGKCTADDPTADEPCQLSLKRDGSSLTGKLLCKRIPNRGTTELTRWVVKPHSMDALKFQVDGCEGL